jgi:hypothetical protein
MALFMSSIHIMVGDGHSTLFWCDPWLDGHRILDLSPELVATMSAKIWKSRTVMTTLLDDAWCRDIKGALTI